MENGNPKQFWEHHLFANFVISELYFLITIVLLSLGAMAYLTFWLVRWRSSLAFLTVIWIGYAIIIGTGGSTVLHALQKERLHWTRFFISTCQLFGSLVQSAGHDQIEFSYSLWSEPFHPEGLPLEAKLPQPDPQFSTRPLDIPQQIQWIRGDSVMELHWQPVPDASEYEVTWLEHPDCEEGWITVYQGAETSFSIETMGWFRVRSLRITPLDDPVYEKISQILVDVASSFPDIGSVYTMRDYSDEAYVFIVCPAMDVNMDGIIDPETERQAPIGETYPREEFVEIPPGVKTPLITDFATEDEWGTWYSASVALYCPDGTREGYVSVDYPVKAWEQNVLLTQITYAVFLVVALTMYFFGVILVTRLNIASEQQRTMANNLHRTVQELVEAKKMADTANRAKNYFLTNMSHEIRTPLNAILGFTGIISRRLLECCPTEQRDDNQQCIGFIEKGSSDLLAIVNDILDFSKADADQVEIEWMMTDPRHIMEDVKNFLLPRLNEKPFLAFESKVEESVPEWIYSDPIRLRQILSNICGNAVKFSEKGTIRFHCCQKVFENTPANINTIEQMYGRSIDMSPFGNGEPITLLQFSVQDEGIGIPEIQMPILFEPFVQVDASLTRKFGGSGLGLAIAKHLTELMGGAIVVHSKEGEGSIFIVTFAISEKHIRSSVMMQFSGIVSSIVSEKPLSGNSVLVVEDGKVNQIVITKMLMDAGATAKIAENGKEAIETIESFESFGREFDVVLMDMQMPVMDGYEATLRLRQKGYKNPIIAVTAHALVGDLEKTLQAGCSAYISKPVDRNKLIDTIRKLTRSPRKKTVQK